MTPLQSELLTRIEAFSFDLPETKFTFAQRLARENGWSAGMAQRVLLEYQRFAFLAMAAGHPVCPSEAVDQAWHQHLTFTQSYWEDFCGQVLGKPLHHGPTRGGKSEEVKHHEMYERTLESYRKFFGHEAPPDLWPAAPARFAEGGDYVRVNRKKVWVLPKPEWLRQAALALLAGAVAFGLAGCLNLAVSSYDDSERAVSTILGLTALAVTFSVAISICRQTKGSRRTILAGDLPSDPYQIAMLNGGPVLAIYAALAELARRGVVEAVNADRIVLRDGAWLPTNLPPFEQAVLDALSAHPTSLAMLMIRVEAESRQLRFHLEDRGLVVPWHVRLRARKQVELWCSVGLLTALLFLIVRQIEFSGLLLVAIVVGFFVFKWLRKMPYRTRFGDQMRKELFRVHDRSQFAGQMADSAGTVPMGVALYGFPILAGCTLTGFAWDQFTPFFRYRDVTNSGGGSSSGNDSTGGWSGGCSSGDSGGGYSGNGHSGGDSSSGPSGCSSGSSGCSSGSSGCSSGSSGCGGGGGGGN